MSNKRFSEKQLNDARWQIEDRGRIHTPIKCRTCTGGSHIFEIECTMCNKTKGLEEFSKTQRKADDPVSNKIAGNATTLLTRYRNATSVSRSRLQNSLSIRTSTRTRTLHSLRPITLPVITLNTSPQRHPHLARPPMTAGQATPRVTMRGMQRALIAEGESLYTPS